MAKKTITYLNKDGTYNSSLELSQHDLVHIYLYHNSIDKYAELIKGKRELTYYIS